MFFTKNNIIKAIYQRVYMNEFLIKFTTFSVFITRDNMSKSPEIEANFKEHICLL